MAYRARFNALFMLSLPLAFSLSSALAGAILNLDGLFGISGWQWLFLVEGAPAVVVGLVSLRYLSDYPKDARWLPEDERRALEAAIEAEGGPSKKESHVGAMLRELPTLLRNPVVLTCGAIYVALNFGLISLTSWTPMVIKSFGLPVGQVGIVTMIAPLSAAVVMIFWGRWSDLHQERVINTTVALLLGAAGWALAGLAESPEIIVCGFVLAAIGVYATYAISFAISQTYVARESRPVAIAAIGVMGNIGGVFVPMIVGYIKTATGSFTGGFLVIAAVMALAAVLTFRLQKIIGKGLSRPAASLEASV
jgi:MFS transporter, ACS family, tartrate transporter